ncbi:hypothetical protein ACFL0M_04190 [Thermodesulfobacteriota bacterium]
MSFKENLLIKIKIDKLAGKVILSLKHQDGPKVDKDAMKSLLEMSPYQYIRKRDLDLYVQKEASDTERVLVLDNELSLYRTSLDDVVLRKSPTIKEMISIRNAIKILNDTDVVVSKKTDTVNTIQTECIDMLDLSYDRSDLEAIAREGSIALEIEDTEGVLESLVIFSELLGLSPLPRSFFISDHEVMGALTQKENGGILYGPIVIYRPINNSLNIIDEQISSLDKQKVEFARNVALGKEKASVEGPYVFHYLKDTAVKKLFDKF